MVELISTSSEGKTWYGENTKPSVVTHTAHYLVTPGEIEELKKALDVVNKWHSIADRVLDSKVNPNDDTWLWQDKQLAKDIEISGSNVVRVHVTTTVVSTKVQD